MYVTTFYSGGDLQPSILSLVRPVGWSPAPCLIITGMRPGRIGTGSDEWHWSAP